MSSAKGIPDRSHYGDHQDFNPGDLVDWLIQEHRAERAGRHYDVRFGDKERGLHSWATKRELPKPGGMIALFQQPLHEHGYKGFEGTIPSGQYGAGKVRKHDEGQALITAVTPEGIHFTLGHTQTPKRFVLVAPKDESKRWLLINTTPTKPIPYAKKHYKSVSLEAASDLIDSMEPGTSVQAKIDGAASLIKLLDTGKPEIASYRISKRTGGPIIHTERVFHGRPEADFPANLKGTILRGELYGVKRGKPIPPQELGGILNSTVGKSIGDQRSRGIQLKNLVFDIQQLGQKKVTGETPYAERQQMIQDVLKHLPKGQFTTPPEVSTGAAARKLLDQIVAGKHPLTSEGIVIHPPKGVPLKYKQTDEHDVYITGVFPGEGKWQGTGGGGFTYALKPGGPTVGKVGTGFDDRLRRDIAANPEDYIGRVAKIRAQDQHPSGAFRAPSLLSLHEDYPMKKHSYEAIYDKVASKLSSKTRNALPSGQFAEPEERKYPIEDKNHARNALSRVSAHGSSAEKAEVRQKVHSRYPEIGKTAAYEGAYKLAEKVISPQKNYLEDHQRLNPNAKQPRYGTPPPGDERSEADAEQFIGHHVATFNTNSALQQKSDRAQHVSNNGKHFVLITGDSGPATLYAVHPTPGGADTHAFEKISSTLVRAYDEGVKAANAALGYAKPTVMNPAINSGPAMTGAATQVSQGAKPPPQMAPMGTLGATAATAPPGVGAAPAPSQAAMPTAPKIAADNVGPPKSPFEEKPAPAEHHAPHSVSDAILGGALGTAVGGAGGLMLNKSQSIPDTILHILAGGTVGGLSGAGVGALAGHHKDEQEAVDAARAAMVPPTQAQTTNATDKSAAFRPTTSARLQMQQHAMSDPRMQMAQGAQAAQSKFLGAAGSGTRTITGPAGPSGMELQRGPVNQTAPMLGQRTFQGPGGFSGMQTSPGPVNQTAPMMGQRVMQGPAGGSGLELDRTPKPQRYGVG